MFFQVIILSHHPVGSSGSIVSATRWWQDVILEYSDVIIMHLSGHSHHDEFHLVHLSVSLSAFLSLCIFLRLSVCLSIHLPVSFYLSVYISIYLSIYIYIYISALAYT